MRRTAKHLCKRPANIDWMLNLIASMDESHEYFSKNYRKPKKIIDPAEVVQEPGLLSNQDGFFDSLPLAKNIHKKHKINLSSGCKVERERQKLLKMERQVEQLR